MRKNMPMAAAAEIEDGIGKVIYKETPKALPDYKQKLYDQLNAAQGTISYACVLEKVKRELKA